jgi:hypothetical protein
VLFYCNGYLLILLVIAGGYYGRRSLVVVTGFLGLCRAEGTYFPQDGGRAPSIEAGPTEHQESAI